MKNVNGDFENIYEEKVQDIKKRKRNLRFIQDPKIVKKIKKDLEREKRGVKRSEKHQLKEWIKNELNR
jgi:predicted secreted Zn-dependent protease